MTDRHKPHNGRDLSGHYRVRQEDVDDMLNDVTGTDILRDDVRLGGAVADTGVDAASTAREIARMIDDNRDNVRRLAGKDEHARGTRSRKR